MGRRSVVAGLDPHSHEREERRTAVGPGTGSDRGFGRRREVLGVGRSYLGVVDNRLVRVEEGTDKRSAWEERTGSVAEDKGYRQDTDHVHRIAAEEEERRSRRAGYTDQAEDNRHSLAEEAVDYIHHRNIPVQTYFVIPR